MSTCDGMPGNCAPDGRECDGSCGMGEETAIMQKEHNKVCSDPECQADNYFAPTVETIMVPVKVSYHDATDTVYKFDPPTMEDVTKALTNNRCKNLEDSLRVLATHINEGRAPRVLLTLIEQALSKEE